MSRRVLKATHFQLLEFGLLHVDGCFYFLCVGLTLELYKVGQTQENAV